MEDATHDEHEIRSENGDADIRSDTTNVVQEHEDIVSGMGASEPFNVVGEDEDILDGMAASESFSIPNEYTGRGYNLRSRNNRHDNTQLFQDAVIDMHKGGSS